MSSFQPKNFAVVRPLAAAVPGAFDLALDAVDRGQATVIAVLQDARTELRTAVDGSLELAEKLATGALRFARTTAQRLDDASNDALQSAQKAITGAVARARDARRAAGELTEAAPSQAA
jgi:hypothetical protein